MKSDTWNRLGNAVTNVVAKLTVRGGKIQGAIDPQPSDKNGCTFGKEPEHAARCPASRRVPGGDKSALGAGGNSSERYAAGAWGGVGGSAKVIQFVAVGSHAAGGPRNAPRTQGSPADFNSATAQA